ncbi:PKD domain-containing protein [Candidatus Gracilibacteria bacterium]|nr:PKD domain-containing protein [Candidatus Gracilibacteria bacterium]
MAKNLIQKIVAILVILLLLAGVFSFFMIPQQAQASALEDFFQQDDGGLSFTDYQGGVVELTTDQGYDPSLVQATDARSYILRIVNFALGFLGLIAVIVVIYGGVVYVTAAGESDKTEKGRSSIKFAVIGLLIVLGSFAFVNTVIRGAGGGGDGDGQYVVGPNQGGSFNASATEVRTIAREIYTNFILFAESYEEVKNIQADLKKPQLDYQQDPDVTKADQLTFLDSARSKLLNIRSRMPKFSATYTTINDLVRFLDSYTAQISIIGRNETDGNTVIEKRFATWERFRAAFLSDNPDQEGALISLVQPIKTDFIQSLDISIAKIDTIHASLGNVDPAAAGSSIGLLYEDLNSKYTTFKAEINDWSINNDASEVDQAGQRLYEAIQATVKYEDALRDLKSVIARLRADVVTGNAPLYVNFDVLESIDPAGGNIVNVDWSRIEGRQTIDGQNVAMPADAVDCNVVSQNEAAEVLGTTFRQCIFRHPGTYTATVIINSNDPTQYVSGLSTLTIKVNPPTTKINMDVTFGDKNIEIIEYYDNGILKIDKDLIPVTLEEAKSGLRFNTDIDNVKNYRWDFGDGDIQEGANLNTIAKTYDIAGRYLVTLEVTNALNQIDRKIFTLDVGNVAGRINVSPGGELFINTPIRFTAEQSTAVGGSIRGYEWSITPEGGQALDLAANSGRSNFAYEFKEPGVYIVNLRVVSQAGTGQAPPLRLILKSKPPVAVIKHEIPETNQPSTVHLNAAGSFDPDGPSENLVYEWRITPESNNGENWQVLEGAVVNGIVSQRDPIIKFKKSGDYDISLKVIDQRTLDADIDEESDTETFKLNIDRVLDVDWVEEQEVTAVVDNTGYATVNFGIVSDNAVAYEVDFGDGETESGEIADRAQFTHTYTSAGRYEVEVTVYDDDDNDNSLTRRFFVGGGDTPVARAAVEVDGNQILNLNDPIRVSTSDVVTFDASESKNTDGTGRDLTYQWDFGDLGTSSKRRDTHKYRELSPAREGFYTVKLRVSDQDDPTKFDEDEIYINVVNEAPYFSSVQGTLVDNDQNGKPVTPTEIDMRVFGATDDDGQVVKYKWWYFDLDDPSEQLGIRITDTPSTRLTIGTRGREGQEVTYGFGLEITDDSGMSYSNQDEIDSGNHATIEVINGQNALPVAKFAASASSVFVGDTVVLTSSSTDSDGQIETYIWDLEGDGFFNNAPTDEPSIEYNFPAKNTEGIQVRLKVIDDKGGEATSEPIKIIVDSNAQPPTAAFTYQVIDGSKGMKVQFTDNSRVDTDAGAQIIAHHWDFDTALNSPNGDSDGDGVKDNDIDSNFPSPSRLYTKVGTYQVKLTVTDSQGNQDSVTNAVQIPLSNPPTAAFKYQILDGKIVFENNSQPDPESQTTLEKYIWDFDLDSEFASSDSDGDGDSENDTDSELKSPVYTYPNPGTYQVKLTVIDSQGSRDEVTNEVIFTGLPGPIQGTSTPIQGSTSIGTTPSNIKALLNTAPKPAADSILYLTGTSAQVKFDFRESLGDIAYYAIDKDILVDSNGDGIADNDEDFKTALSGTWTTNYQKTSSRKVARLTVVDRNGRQNSVSQEIIFQ